MVKIGVLGAGSWGLGLAMLLHNNGHDVTVWSVFPDEINELNATRENKKCLPGVIFPESVKFCADTEKVVTESDVLILAVASPYTRSTAKIVAPRITNNNTTIEASMNSLLLSGSHPTSPHITNSIKKPIMPVIEPNDTYLENLVTNPNVTIPNIVNIKQYLGKSIRLITNPDVAAIPFPPLNPR